jgi:uncharacterized protein (TIGR03086 family)
MSTPPADRFRRVAGGFTDVVAGVAPDGWGAPAPCDGWAASDVVRHLVEWVPGFFDRCGITLPTSPPDTEPLVAWSALRDGLQGILDEPASSVDEIDVPPMGPHTVADAIDKFVTGDVLVHTWDLARAVGREVVLDPEVAAAMLAGIEPLGDVLVASGHFAKAVPTGPDAGVQERLVAATGRDPAWQR